LAAFKEAVEPLEDFRRGLRAGADPDHFGDWRRNDSLGASLEDPEMRRALSSLREKLRQAGGNAHLLTSCLPERGRFSLTVPGPLIHLKI
jgi:hypothetical protein